MSNIKHKKEQILENKFYEQTNTLKSDWGKFYREMEESTMPIKIK